MLKSRFRLQTILMSRRRETLTVTECCRSANTPLKPNGCNPKMRFPQSQGNQWIVRHSWSMLHNPPSIPQLDPEMMKKGHFQIETTYHQHMVLSYEKISSTRADQSTSPSYRVITLFSSPSEKVSMNLFSKSSGADRTIFSTFMVNCPLKGNNKVNIFELDQ